MNPLVEDVLTVNADFYAAFETADIDAMMEIWLDDPGAICVHPGGPVLRGSRAIARSWSLIMANTPYIQFFLTDVEVSLIGETAIVSCTENVLTGDARMGTQSFGGATALATNVYTRVGGRWRLWAHHASPVLSSDHDELSDD